MDDDKYLRVLQVLESLDRDERTRPWEKVASFFKRTAAPKLPKADGNGPPASLETRRPKPEFGAELRTGSANLSRAQPTLPSGSLADSPKRKRPHRISLAASLALATVIAVASVAAAWQDSIRGAVLSFVSAPRGEQLDLRVEQQLDGSLLVGWNPKALKTAKTGLLEIEDGSEHRSLRLDSSQFANGSLMYSPATRDVTFRLQVFDAGGRQVSRFVRVINGSVASPLFDATELAESSPPTKARLGQNTEQAELNTKINRAVAQNTGSASSGTQFPTKISKDVRRSDPPSIGPSASHSATDAELQPRSQAELTSPKREAEPVRSLPQTHSASTSAPAGGTSNSGKSLSDATYIPPRPLKQVVPSQANFGYLELSRPVDIEVRVRIDARGKVAEAQVVNTPSGNENVLTSAALSAAKQWLFEPAQMGGDRVPSDHRIVFHFRPSVEQKQN
ncbi:MAG: TonB family protein [Acidobacteriaceae bacterium]|nr:TonB family protein [Acidobacteriaceae bacterium]MBV9502228.1 TonB family protein [Acidobacteriaceae bacterium]